MCLQGQLKRKTLKKDQQQQHSRGKLTLRFFLFIYFLILCWLNNGILIQNQLITQPYFNYFLCFYCSLKQIVNYILGSYAIRLTVNLEETSGSVTITFFHPNHFAAQVYV